MRTVARVGLFPVYRDNPYLNTMYLAARARGYETRETSTLEGAERILSDLVAGDIFHMQWTAPVVQRAETDAEASGRRRRFEAAVERSLARGIYLVWTIHNVIPHDARWLDEEIRLCRFLAAKSSFIHVMSPGTVSAAASEYQIDPAKVVRVPHPSYAGTYDAPPSKADARESLGVRPSDQTILFFGQMRPYKGLSTLFGAIDALPSERTKRTTLLLAGRTAPDEQAALEALLPPTVTAIRNHEYIVDAEVPTWFSAADVAVFPYAKILNSGSVHLAATFGLPVVLPDEPHIVQEFAEEPWVRFFASGNTDSLRLVLDDDSTYNLASTAAMDFSRRRSPFTISNRWADVLEQVHTSEHQTMPT